MVERDRQNTDRKSGGLFRGSFRKPSSSNHPILRDDEDGVNRCPTCAWELEDGVCSGCGVAYGSDGEAYSDENISFSEDYESDLSDQHYEHGSDDNLDTDDEEELAALIEMNEDISLDGDGHSVHADYANLTGNTTFGRADVHGLARQFRHPEITNAAFRRRYTPSMRSDMANREDDNRGELVRLSDASSASEETDEDTGSLDDFIDDKFDDSATDDQQIANFSPLLGDEDDTYLNQSRNHFRSSMVHSDDDTLSSGYAADHHYPDDDNRDNESNDSRTASSPSHRGRSREIPRYRNRHRQILSRTSTESPDEGTTSNPGTHNSRPIVHQAKPNRRIHPEPAETRSVLGSPILPQRSRKRRFVVDDGSSDDESGSDVNIPRARKRKGSSSGSITVGR